MITWKVRGHEAIGIKSSWGHGGSWNGGDMEPQGCVAMESQLRSQRDRWAGHVLFCIEGKLHGEWALEGPSKVVGN